MSEWRLLRIEQVMRMAQGDPERLEVLRAHILEHMTSLTYSRIGYVLPAKKCGGWRLRFSGWMEHGWRYDEDAVNVALWSYGGSYAVAAAFRNEVRCAPLR